MPRTSSSSRRSANAGYREERLIRRLRCRAGEASCDGALLSRLWPVRLCGLPGRRGKYERVVRVALPRIIFVAVLSAIAMAASGCGDSDAEAESPPATTTEQVETQPPAEPTFDIAK